MRLLLVEDDIALGEGICDGLRQEGYTLDWLRDGVSGCLLYTSPSPRDQRGSRMPSSA